MHVCIYHRICELSLVTLADQSVAKKWLNCGDFAAWFYISGTYNNQYMLLDLKKVELRKTLHNGALWIVEQIPG